jgi:hypothetical protein
VNCTPGWRRWAEKGGPETPVHALQRTGNAGDEFLFCGRHDFRPDAISSRFVPSAAGGSETGAGVLKLGAGIGGCTFTAAVTDPPNAAKKRAGPRNPAQAPTENLNGFSASR